MLEFQQSEPITERRHWVIVLVDSTDGVTGKTGQTGQVYLSKNGATPVLSTNSLVEVDSTNMPGHYYVILTSGELDTLGFISLVKKTGSTLAFHDRAIVSYNNPFTSSGGFASAAMSSGKSGGITKIQAKALLDDIRTIVQEELAKEETEDDIEEVQEQKDYDEKLDQIIAAVTAEKEQSEIDLSPVLKAIANIPKSSDYSKNFMDLANDIKVFGQARNVETNGIEKAIVDFVAKLQEPLAKVDTLMASMVQVEESLTKFIATLSEQSDMDKRFDAMTSASNNKALTDLTAKIKAMAIQLIDLNFNLKSKKLK